MIKLSLLRSNHRIYNHQIRRSINYQALKDANKDISQITEVKQMQKFLSELNDVSRVLQLPKDINGEILTLEGVGMNKEIAMQSLTAAIATFHVHVESRISSFLGQGFYTIGPCGEELLSAIAPSLKTSDAVALHYRHVATSINRMLSSGKTLDEILLDRARGHVCSIQDPVTGGVHCSIGGSPTDYLVTSTLASQATPAVGRALASGLAATLKVPCLYPSPDFVSFVSLGEGSVNNGHFLSAVNLAEYAKFKSFKCPLVFAISDNQLCISLKNKGWVNEFVKSRIGLPIFRADGSNMASVYKYSKEAIDYARSKQRPVCLLFSNITRRFGHAATDRQSAYLTDLEIESFANRNVLEGAVAQVINSGYANREEIIALYQNIAQKTAHCFEVAVKEKRITTVGRSEMIDKNSRPMWVPTEAEVPTQLKSDKSNSTGKKDVMRKLMNLCYDEVLSKHAESVYIGEDVEHGGYYLVSENLKKKYGFRVADFIPDETSLIGVGMGYAQGGLTPIVEIPYAKYLDCGYDIYEEAGIMNWLSNGKQPNGMVIRLQGFGRGIFGGNFHTHNTLHIPPGIDAVCFSNGLDYVRGLRNAIMQAKNGRVVMSVDSTHLLNLRHINDKDNKWMSAFPSSSSDVMPFDEVRVYSKSFSPSGDFGVRNASDAEIIVKKKLAIVSYGDGILESLKAKYEAEKHLGISFDDIDVIDSPYLSLPSKGLMAVLPYYENVLFVDICKEGQAPLEGFIPRLNTLNLLKKWRSVAACRAYNPLSSSITFVNQNDILDQVKVLL